MSIGEALRRPELRQGFAWGAAIGVPVVVGGVVARMTRWRALGWPLAGVVVVAASGVGLLRSDAESGLPLALPAGLLLLGLGGIGPLPWRVAALATGATALASATPEELPAWAVVVVFLAAASAGATAPLVDGRHRPGVGPALLAGTALGSWACVPDVEQAGVVAGAAVATAALSLLVPLRLGRAGAPAATGLVLWAAAGGAVGRPVALVGATAGLGLLVAGVVCLPDYPTVRVGVLTVVGQAVLVAMTSRVAGLQSSLAPAMLIAAGTVLCVVAGVSALGLPGRSRGERDASRSRISSETETR